MEVVILQTFYAYPSEGARKEYLEGWTVDASREDAEAWIAKGLARASGTASSLSPITHD